MYITGSLNALALIKRIPPNVVAVAIGGFITPIGQRARLHPPPSKVVLSCLQKQYLVL